MWDDSANLGGRIVKDRLWFFANYRNEGYDRDILNAFYPATGYGDNNGKPLQTNTRGRLWLTKMALQVSKNNKVTGFYHSDKEQQRRRGSQFVGPDGRELNVGPFLTYGMSYQMVKGNSLVVSLTGGHFHRHSLTYALPVYDKYGPTAVKTMDLTTQIATGDTPNDTQYITHGNDDAAGNVSYFRGNMAGNHQIKAGYDFVHSWYSQQFGSQPAGNYILLYQNLNPFEIQTFNYPVKPQNFQDYLGFYGQDNWSVNDHLTVALGIRWAHDNLHSPAQCSLATDFAPSQCYDKVQLPVWNSVAPRVHFAYDIGGDGKSVVKAGWGRYVAYGSITSDLLVTERNNKQTTTWLWHDLNGDKLYESGEVNLSSNSPDFQNISGVTNGVVNPDSPQPMTDEYVLSYEHEVFNDWAVRGTTIYSRNFNLRRTETIAIPYSAYSIPITGSDPGFDGKLGTADDPGRTVTYYEYPTTLSGISNQATRLVGWPGDQTFKTVEASATKRLSKGWQFNTSWVATKINQPFADEQPLNPNSEINTALNYWEITAKVAASYAFPWFSLSGDMEHRSGTPQAPQFQFTGGTTIKNLVVNTQPLGSIALPNTNLANFRVTREFKVLNGKTLQARVDFFNVTNANFVTARNLRESSTYLVPSAIILPRVVQIGASFKF
jgi:outer membrane receptor protein involved in Fe transport